MIVDFTQLTAPQRYGLMTQTILPRPIAWVLTANREGGGYNLAPFSYFNAVSSDPALVSISIGRKPDDEAKDTIYNLSSPASDVPDLPLVIHIASVDCIDALNATSANRPRGTSEVAENNLELVDWAEFPEFPLPHLACAPIAYAARVAQMIPIGGASQQTLLLAEIVAVYIRDDCVTVADNDTGKHITVDALAVNPLARLGAAQYANLGEVIVRKRPA